MPSLLESFRLVAFDLRGHGQTTSGDVGNLDALLDDIDSVVNELELISPLLVGHSFGGNIAVAHAARRGGVDGVVSIDGHLDTPSAILQRVGARVPSVDEVVHRLKSSAFEGDSDAVEAWITVVDAQGYGGRERLRRRFRPTGDGQWTRRPLPIDEAATYATMLGHELRADLQALPVPLLYIGAVGPAAGSPQSEEVKRKTARMAMSWCELTTLWITASHFVHFDEPNSVADAINTFASV